MFLVRRAGEVMDKDVLVLPQDLTFDAFSTSDHAGRTRHVVVTQGDRIVGVLRVNTALRQGLEGAFASASLGDVASAQFAIARREDIMFNVIGRMWRRNAMMTVVVRPDGVPRPRCYGGYHQRACGRFCCRKHQALFRRRRCILTSRIGRGIIHHRPYYQCRWQKITLIRAGCGFRSAPVMGNNFSRHSPLQRQNQAPHRYRPLGDWCLFRY